VFVLPLSYDIGKSHSDYQYLVLFSATNTNLERSGFHKYAFHYCDTAPEFEEK
jgi:hypothetical protein